MQRSDVDVVSKNQFSLREMDGDLFDAPTSASLCHCISSDCKLGRGIAKQFKEKFDIMNTLKAKKTPVGGVVVLKEKDRYIYKLVTKENYYQKPTYTALAMSLEAMKLHALTHNVKKICMPQIGCGLDNLKWSWVKMRIEQVFESTDMCIDVYCKKRTSYWAVNMLCCK